MNTSEYVAVGVDFEEVPVLVVEPQAADRERRVVLEVLDALGVAHRVQTVLDHLKQQRLVLWRLVHCSSTKDNNDQIFQ